MIFTLTMNPCLDRYLYVDKLVVDDTIRVKKVVDYPAGKGIDVSRVIKELGGVSVAISLLGGETGRKIEEMLDKEGVIYSTIRVDVETRTNIILETSEGQYRFSMPGRKVSKKKLQSVLEILNAIVRKDDIVVISGSLPKGVSPDFYTGIIFTLKQWGVYVYFDADGEKLRAGLLGNPDVIKPNEHEIQRLIEKEIRTLKEYKEEGLKLLEKYNLKEILLTLGSKGSMLISHESCYYAKPLNVKVKSAVGAGDSFLAAYVLKSEIGKEEAFRWANAAGNAAVMTPGTELCKKDDVLRLLSMIEVSEI
ncbi:ribokinase [Thermosipho melanesiensis]|uniref:PfkB domain protein n=2 Tax=Thermosipho melanesiensis TaxID=46541 RepID=A6LP18_THEM4|nr:1-phosphofructokinase family hexose kinase [Thermosipho melanesiensis]ABR31669.1 PfkB domain protein [Thermosipho melanesiensis BI429]APT74696.1 ribokinase [Thermosipho melanesiensis]OOC35193.1 ribokinase [Thermosipho melanesiensis]OOC35403.1 ribokinase [Thermosipho melanesiensis]OOC36654.1 ribokinase [Thermosipho melanesiensis]